MSNVTVFRWAAQVFFLINVVNILHCLSLIMANNAVQVNEHQFFISGAKEICKKSGAY